MTTVLTRCRVSSEQLNLLLSFMEEHRDFAAGKQSIYSRYSASKLWRLLAERLNAAAADSGGVRKSPDKWCRYWADIKYKARKKAAAGGTMGDLSTVEERLQNILDTKHKPCCGGCSQTDNQLDEDGKSAPIDDDMYSEGSGTGTGDAQRLTTEELLAEAAMRGALAAERQAESVTKGVQILRELVELVRASLMPHPTLASHPPPATHPSHVPHAPHAPHLAPPDNTLTLHHHHRL